MTRQTLNSNERDNIIMTYEEGSKDDIVSNNDNYNNNFMNTENINEDFNMRGATNNNPKQRKTKPSVES